MSKIDPALLRLLTNTPVGVASTFVLASIVISLLNGEVDFSAILWKPLIVPSEN